MVGETVAEQDNQQDLMTTQKSYSRLAALIFAVVSGLRLIRAVSGLADYCGCDNFNPVMGKLGRLRYCWGACLDWI